MAVVALQMFATLANWREMNELVASNHLREQLARAAMTIAVERSHTVLELRGLAEGEISLATLRAASDRAITRASGQMSTFSRADQPDILGDLEAGLMQQRAGADAASTPAERTEAAEALRAFGTSAVNRLNSLRLTLLAREQPTDPTTALAFALRAQTSSIFEYLIRSRTLLAIVASGEADDDAVLEIERNAVRLEAALDILRGNPELIGGNFPDLVASLRQRYYSGYLPAERNVLYGGDQIQTVLAVSDDLLDELGALLDTLFAASRDRLTDLRFAAAMGGSSWLALFLIGGLTVLASNAVVRRRVAEPLGELSEAMMQLARGELDTPLPTAFRKDEIGAMTDALRVFRANALRRRRLQEERLALHARLKEAYRQLKIDLEAAAAVQATLLPPPASLGSVAFHGYFRPSRYIAGDTYDVVLRPDGRIEFFEIDVAGHGAPAALISVASHHSITQASLQRQPGAGLAELVAEVNADWPDSFPYFTMILGEIDPMARCGRLVQAGHPSPLLIGRDGSVRLLGEGGLPVGILPGATYEEIVFDFGPGDRLLLYSDGLVEAEDSAGCFFSEEQLVEIVQAHGRASTLELIGALDRALRSWRGSGTLDDDVTILILEEETEDERA